MTATTSITPIPAAIREQFPALAGPTVFLDNAGGSQLPFCVINAIRDYLERSYAQLGGEYEPSIRAARTVQRAHDFVAQFLNGANLGHVVLGPSTTALCHLLAGAYADALGPGEQSGRDEIIIAAAGHEANIGPWTRLAARGFTIRLWPTQRDDAGRWRPRLDTLRSMLSPRTRIVAMPHVSNILGEIWNVRAAADLARAAGARTVIDGVAYAPHHPPDVRALGCDWYVYSTYKVLGPHMAALFGTRDAFAELTGPNHYFIPRDSVPYKFELGGVNHEGCAGLAALWDYCCLLTGADPATPLSRPTIERAFAAIARRELELQARLLAYLNARPDVRIIGPREADASRVCTISFVHRSRPSGEIAREANALGLGIRYGHFYSLRLIDEMGLDPREGVVRISLLHYNSDDDVDRAIAFLDRALR
ncbi:MAG: aminotransferase class V-fold PLP-dependent enzyme [Phycisphaerales bacterium]|nr:aminotransferase class V-fold PLP-dependent enzyme [Phycisphaerales bacterium]